MSAPQQQEFEYQGSELDIFAHARNWKAYWVSQLVPYVRGDVLEVGAGIGANTPQLRALTKERFVSLEPDGKLLATLAKETAKHGLKVEPVCGTLQTLPEAERFDTILYIDVVEHLEDDVSEVRQAAARLRPGGHVIVLSPAHQYLYSPFDKAIGHYRRYNRDSLLRCTPSGCSVALVRYLDSAGVTLSFGNRLLMKQSYPTLSQILFWDRWVIPLSRVSDPLTGFRLGKTIIGVWQKQA